MAHHDDLTTDVLVVGAGASGLPAAIAAARAGAKVTLIEEDPVVGG
ncbi:MAG: FAD-dependent oxidoreductase, partial [Armatimonadota bacterium]